MRFTLLWSVGWMAAASVGGASGDPGGVEVGLRMSGGSGIGGVVGCRYEGQELVTFLAAGVLRRQPKAVAKAGSLH